jgi:short-subunit dehydrogenase
MQQTIFITGAGSGIGAMTARIFAQRGWLVGLYDINLESVTKLAQELGNNAHGGQLDVTDETSVKAALKDFSEQTNGQLHVLCNNAGIFEECKLADSDFAFLQKMIRINAEGVVACSKFAYPYLKQTAGAKLINVASSASIYGLPLEAVYSATKFFVRGFTEGMRLEWQDDDIGVSTVMPGYVATPMTDGKELSFVNKNRDMVSAEDVASTIWRAAHGSKQYWILPLKDRVFLSTLSRILPLQWLPAVMGGIFNKVIDSNK